MTIMQIEALTSGQHPVQSQSHRTTCWLDGWIAVPEALEETLYTCGGFCEPVIEDGVLVDVIPIELPEPLEPEPNDIISDAEALAILLGGV